MARPSKYPESFRRDAVELVLTSDRPIRQIAEQLGVSHETLRSWVRDARRAKDPEQVAQAEQALETAAMRKRLAELEKENEILRKAAAYFAREMDR
ncbi:transposase [Lentzea indica]|jgi:transposase|nr:transposase [Lentzea indica]